MSGTWTRRRRGASSRESSRRGNASSVPAPGPALPSSIQQQVPRSIERVMEDAELEGVLNLTSRKLKQFPVAVALKYDLSDVVAVDVGNNRLTELPVAMLSLHSLESLRARGNLLRRVPSSLSLLRSLSFLDLSNNSLCELPVALFELSLEVLLLAGNRLESVPRQLRTLSSSLTELDLSFNQISSLHPDLALLKSLRVLNLSNNRLESFPSELCRLSLHTLDVRGNRLSNLPIEMAGMTSLRLLSLQPNPLIAPPLSIIYRGREHVFKWLEQECKGANPLRPASSSAGTLPSVLARNGLIVGKRVVSSRLTTAGGSDSGYDEKVLSSCENQTSIDDVFGASKSSRSSACPESPTSENNCNLMHNIDLKASQCMEKSNGEKVEAVKISPPKESPLPSLQPNKELSAEASPNATRRNRPVSKVAPMPCRSSLQSSVTSRPSTSRLLPSSRPTPPPSSTTALSRNPSSLSRPPSSSRPAPSLSRPSLAARSSLLGQPRQKQPQTVKDKSLPAVSPKMTGSTNSLSAVTKSPLPTRRSAVSAAKAGNAPVRVVPVARESARRSSAATENAVLEGARKILEERLGLTVEGSSLAARLSDGVLLCRIANHLHPAVCTAISVPQQPDSLLPAVKCRRNADAFLDACRSLRVKTLCSSDDIIHRRNLSSVAKAVVDLQKAVAEMLPVSHV